MVNYQEDKAVLDSEEVVPDSVEEKGLDSVISQSHHGRALIHWPIHILWTLSGYPGHKVLKIQIYRFGVPFSESLIDFSFGTL